MVEGVGRNPRKERDQILPSGNHADSGNEPLFLFIMTTAHKKEHCYDLRCLLIGRKKNLANEKTAQFITMLFFVGLVHGAFMANKHECTRRL